jgi:hypothetical protein
MKTSRQPETPVPEPIERSDVADLANAVQDAVGPEPLTEQPRVALGPAIGKARTVGGNDAAGTPFDVYSHNPVLPSEQMVLAITGMLSVLIGERAFAILAAFYTGTLTPPMPELKMREGWRAMSWRTRMLVGLIAGIEAFLGANLFERLVGAPDSISWLVGVGWSLILTLSLLAAAGWISEHRPALVANWGLPLAGAVGLVFVALIAFYAYALAGGRSVTTGGVSGGGLAGTAPQAASSVNWVFLAVYFTAMLLFGAVLLISHVHDLGVEKKRYAMAVRTAKEAQYDQEQQRQLAIQLLTACVELAAGLQDMVQAITRAYVAGARRILPPALSSMWNSDHLENCQVAEPAWVTPIKAEIEKLKKNAPSTPVVALKRIT